MVGIWAAVAPGTLRMVTMGAEEDQLANKWARYSSCFGKCLSPSKWTKVDHASAWSDCQVAIQRKCLR